MFTSCRPLVLAVFVVLLLVAVCWIRERTTDGVNTSVMATQRCAHLTWTLTPTLVVTLGNVHTVVLVPSLVYIYELRITRLVGYSRR